MNISWDILKLEYIPNKNGLENVIANVNFRCTGEETVNGVLYSSICETNATLEEPDVNNFTPLNEVTKEQVISWVETTSSYRFVVRHLTGDLKMKQKPQTIELISPFD